MSESETPEIQQPPATGEGASAEPTVSGVEIDAGGAPAAAAEDAADTAPAEPVQSTHSGHEEEIHMPPNSYWPVVTAIGVAITLVGLLTVSKNPAVFVVGLVVLAAGVGAWIRDATTEFQDLH